MERINNFVIGTGLVLGGALINVLVSLKRKEGKKFWEHLIYLILACIVGLLMSLVLKIGGVEIDWYIAVLLISIGAAFEKFYKILTETIPNGVGTLVEARMNKDKSNIKEKSEE